jgi:chromosome segregation protein
MAPVGNHRTGGRVRFARLRLNGFKSFVDPTDLVIREGLTGVVGPNGCGKSNLLEALRWVMGENRPTAVRGGGMEDVIFAGAATRPARHFAEVALIIDNSERLAPSGFNEQDQIEIVRRITRDAGSAYRANAREVRARDIQVLFADAATGAQSPALVRQGQISELINARPKSRRRVLEDAAGIGGLYQRRHEAELRLQATEANLARIDDVVEQLAGQLAVLARQVRAAERYRAIGEDLRRAEGMLLLCRWREADAARVAADAALRAQLVAVARAETAARAAADAREAAEAALPPRREEAAIAGAVLQRLLVQRDRLAEQEDAARKLIAELDGKLAQLARDRDREAGLNRDAGETIARLDRELAEIGSAHGGHEAGLAKAAELARAAGADLTAHEAAQAKATEDAARLAARHQSAARLVQDTRKVLDRAETEAARWRDGVAQARAALDRAGAAQAAAETAEAGAARQAAATEAALAAAEAARGAAQAREADARAARSEAEGEAGALRAEAAALGRLVERETRGGPQVLDLVRVAPGFERALGAALADDLRAPLLGGGRRSGWTELTDYAAAAPLPDGVAPLAAKVEVPPVLRRRIAQIGLVPRDRGAALQAALGPGQRLVSVEGDLWRWDGFCAAAEDASSAAAARLQQINRLAALTRDLEEVGRRAAAARQAHEALQRQLGELARADQEARDARRAAEAAAAEVNRALARAEADRTIAAGRLDAAALAVARFDDEAAAARAALAEALSAAADLPDLEGARAAVEDARRAVETARRDMLVRQSAHDELRREGEARHRRRQEIVREVAGWRQRLETAEGRGAELAARQAEAEAALAAARQAPAQLARSRGDLDAAIATAEGRGMCAGEALAAAEAALRAAQGAEREAERTGGEAREARARAEGVREAAEAVLAAAEARIREEAGATPAALIDSLAADPDRMPAMAALETEVLRLKRQREALGAVNLRAEEDARAVEAEHDTLRREKRDLEEAIKRLRAGIAGLNREGRERLLTAFEQVNANFAALFTHLFGGGEARLVLVESDDPLDAGLEILCQPPGKKLSQLSLLSGGEQTLTALALIFGVFLANPAPICVLDEVDAPLDDANVMRFCDLLDEMTRRTDTRFLVITHHAVTMSRMDRLFGVTMVEQGVSQLVSVDLKKAAALVA